MIKNTFYPQKISILENLSNPNPKNMRFCSYIQSINLEEKLLLEYPKLKDKNIFYRVNSNIINKTAILKQNEIERGDTITNHYDNEKEEKVFAIQFVSGDQNIHYPIAYKESDIFLNIEKEFWIYILF